MSFFLFSFGGTKHKNDLQKNNLKGRVKATTELWYSVNTRTGKLEGLPEKTVDVYDSVGDLTSSTIYCQNGKLFCKDYLIYNNSKCLIIKKSFNEHDSLSIIYTIKLDSNSNRAFANTYYIQDNSLESILIYKYDSSGNEIGEKDYSPTEIVVSAKYDSTGKYIGTSKDSYPKDKDGMIGIENVDTSWQCSKWTYKYDIRGNQIREYEFLNDTNKMCYKHIYKYDNKDNQIEVSGYDEPGDKLHARYNCRYENYDAKGNWQKMIRLHNNVVEGITKRTIEYYQ